MILFSCYAFCAILLFVALLWLKLKNRPTKHPLGQDVKLRRQAGEHLRKESEKLMEALVNRLFVLILLPAIGFVLPVLFVSPFASYQHVGVLVAMAALVSISANRDVDGGAGDVWQRIGRHPESAGSLVGGDDLLEHGVLAVFPDL